MIALLFLPVKAGWAQQAMAMQVQRMDSLLNPLSDSLIRNLAGFGVSVFNIKSNLNYRSSSIGKFLNANPQFPFRKGLVMSTGTVDSIPRANRNVPISSRIQHSDTVAGCSEGRWLIQRLLQLQATNGLTQRATEMSTVKFDLVPNSDTISFRYVFASEEYPEFVCTQFNDMFGFFIKGPGITGDPAFTGTALEGYFNMARLPVNGFSVAINSVNSGISGPTGDPTNCRISDEGVHHYRPNEASQHALYNSLAFDGLTSVLQAKAAVIPCQVYHLVLVVSDVGDRIYDSGVFLESGSLISGKPEIQVSPSRLALKDTAGPCLPISVRFSRCSNIPDTWKIPFLISGNAVEGQHFRRISQQGVVPLGSSISLSANQQSDSLILEAIGQDLETRFLVLSYLDPFQPYLGNLPNYIRKADTLYFKGRWRKPESVAAACWYDSLKLEIKGKADKFAGENWQWHSSTYSLTCSDCPQPGLKLDTSDAQVILKQSLGNCQYEDTVVVMGKKWKKPQVVFSESFYSISEPLEGYIYQWWNNNDWLGSSTSMENIATNLQLEVLAPNGCGNRFFLHELMATATQTLSFMEEHMALYPNPTWGTFVLQPKQQHMAYRFELMDSGLKLLDKGQKNGTFVFQKTLKAGTYYISIQLQDGTSTRQRLIVK